MASPKRQVKLDKAIRTLADQVWASLTAYARTLVYVPNPKPEDDDE